MYFTFHVHVRGTFSSQLWTGSVIHVSFTFHASEAAGPALT